MLKVADKPQQVSRIRPGYCPINASHHAWGSVFDQYHHKAYKPGSLKYEAVKTLKVSINIWDYSLTSLNT